MTEQDQNPSYGSGSGETSLYAVEVRTISSRPSTVCGEILTEKWRRITFPTGGQIGIPIETLHPIKDKWLGLYTYQAATALAYWFLAMPDDELSRHGSVITNCCAEARLVKVNLKYSYSTEEVGVGQPISVSRPMGDFPKRET